MYRTKYSASKKVCPEVKYPAGSWQMSVNKSTYPQLALFTILMIRLIVHGLETGTIILRGRQWPAQLIVENGKSSLWLWLMMLFLKVCSTFFRLGLSQHVSPDALFFLPCNDSS